jgi:CRISPR/Cas system-associated endonuclease/helicase Cas3
VIPLNANSLSERKGDLRSRKIARFGLVISLFIVINTAFLKIDSVYADTTNNYRQWAFIQLNNLNEFYCLDELYYKESRWNPKAKNGSHYGIPQGKSKYLLNVNGYKQVEWGIKYNYNRYGSMCKALDHHKIKGWH